MSYKEFDLLSGYWFDATVTSMNQPMTLVLWIKRTAAQWNAGGAKYVAIYAQDMTSNDQQIKFYCGNDLVVFIARTTTDNPSSSINFTADAYDDIWTPIFCRYISAVSRYVYIEDSTNRGSHQTVSRNCTALDELRIGNFNDTGTATFPGKIAEVSLWDAALDESEIDLFCPTPGGETGPRAIDIDTSTSGASCLGYWPLDYDSDTQTDESGTANGSLVATGSRVYDSDHPTITTAGILQAAYYYNAQQIG